MKRGSGEEGGGEARWWSEGTSLLRWRGWDKRPIAPLERVLR